MSGARVHRVQRGEHIARIAAQYGFRSPAIIWEWPENAALRAERPNMFQLREGDELHVPEPLEKSLAQSTATRGRYVLKRRPLMLRLRCRDVWGRPLADAPVVMTADGSSAESQTDADGQIEAEIAPELLRVRVEQAPTTFDLEVGWLDPYGTTEGLLSRLQNLGYDVEDLGGESDLRFVVACFERDRGLPVTGDPAAAWDALVEAHGC